MIVGDLGFTAGTVAVEGPPLKLAYPGILGDDIDVETGKLSARQAFISTLSNLRGALGTLDRIERFVKLTGYVHATPSFTQAPQVMDGASQLMIDIFGQPCARSAIGVAALPGGASVELDTVIQSRHDRRGRPASSSRSSTSRSRRPRRPWQVLWRRPSRWEPPP